MTTDRIAELEQWVELTQDELSAKGIALAEAQLRHLQYEAESVSLNAWVSAIRLAVQRMEATAQKETTKDHTGEEIITGYRFKTGAFHALIGLLEAGPQ